MNARQQPMHTNGTARRVADYDVVIIGAGLAGLSLARHLLRATNKRILILDKRAEIPPKQQKVGESLVQVGGYYFAKVLDMEEHLLHDHFMKYNLRFYFRSIERDNSQFEDYGQAYIRNFSNIPCYQLDRNVLEAELLRKNEAESAFEFTGGVRDLDVDLRDDGPHDVRFSHDGKSHELRATWVVDTTGRGRLLARQEELREPCPIKHGAAFMWVDGLVDIEKLTDASPDARRLNPNRRSTGHLPHWLATNHFMGEGLWFWVIPLRGKTSLGLVYDQRVVSHNDVNSPEKLLEWVCREFPLFERDLPNRRNFDFCLLKEYSHSCRETINPARWAMSGESGRFTDPLYSPGSDFIALHNSLIVDAIQTDDHRELKRKCWLYETLMQSMYGSLLPTYAHSYDALGDQEAFSLKYTWELSVYFDFFVFPFINDLAVNPEFVPAHLSRFSRLGAINASVQAFISGYFQWKQENLPPITHPLFHDFTELETLRRAEKTFYEVGVSGDEAKQVLDDQLIHLTELARYIVAYLCSVVLDDETVVFNDSFVNSIDFKELSFDTDQIRARYAEHANEKDVYEWTLNTKALQKFAAERDTDGRATPVVELAPTGGRVLA